jgi:hypothetical protein
LGAVALALLQALVDLPEKPAVETATFKRVRQARRHELWRVAHPFRPGVAVRVICWFPDDENVVVGLLGFDKKAIGDVFYASAAARGRRWWTSGSVSVEVTRDDRGHRRPAGRARHDKRSGR